MNIFGMGASSLDDDGGAGDGAAKDRRGREHDRTDVNKVVGFMVVGWLLCS